VVEIEFFEGEIDSFRSPCVDQLDVDPLFQVCILIRIGERSHCATEN
jgi:hypothetical protein